MNNGFLILTNGVSAPVADVPVLPMAPFRQMVLDAVLNGGARVAAFFVLPPENGGESRLIAVLAAPQQHQILVASGVIENNCYPAFTTECPAFHWFEREIYEQTGILPQDHPWLKPIRFQPAADGTAPAPGVTDYFQLLGDAAHEVAVGPVHAGVIEPGHFRFQCLGETVHFLEIELGYQHRGLEQLLLNGPVPQTPHWIETAAGDSSIAAATVYQTLIRGLSPDLPPEPESAGIWRAIMLELERIANHTGDLGALAGDVAFLPTASYCGRIRGDYLNLTAMLCGNRFGRSMWTAGGAALPIPASAAAVLRSKMDELRGQLNNALALMFDTPSVLDRLENTGVVTTADAASLGLVGVAARASGLKMDARHDFPLPGIPVLETVPHEPVGDVFARAVIRRQEIAASDRRIMDLLGLIREDLPAAPSVWQVPVLQPDRIAAAVTEGWRGELWQVAVTDANGKFRRFKIVDPSFHNWAGLAMALRGEEISHFPICNKSFNLSYCGHDL